MAINQNHLVEELEGTRCAIVEKNVTEERAAFLKKLLTDNGYTVVVTASPAPKAVPKPAAAAASSANATANDTPVQDTPAPPQTFTVGVTDLRFNPINAIFGRLLHTRDGHVVTRAYWQQKETISHDETPYFERR